MKNGVCPERKSSFKASSGYAAIDFLDFLNFLDLVDFVDFLDFLEISRN